MSTVLCMSVIIIINFLPSLTQYAGSTDSRIYYCHSGQRFSCKFKEENES